MPQYRSRTTTHGRNMAGARGLWRATGMKDDEAFDRATSQWLEAGSDHTPERAIDAVSFENRLLKPALQAG